MVDPLSIQAGLCSLCLFPGLILALYSLELLFEIVKLLVESFEDLDTPVSLARGMNSRMMSNE